MSRRNTEEAKRGRRERQKEAKERRILAAARDLFSEKGFEATTTREIADRADVATGTVFNYFPTKTALLARLFMSDIGGVRDEAFAAIRPEAPIAEQIAFVFSRFIDYYESRPRLAKVIARELILLEGAERDGMLQFTIGFQLGLASLIERAQEKGEIRAGVPPLQIAFHAFGLYTLSLASWLGGFFLDRTVLDLHLLEQLRLFFDGLTPR